MVRAVVTVTGHQDLAVILYSKARSRVVTVSPVINGHPIGTEGRIRGTVRIQAHHKQVTIRAVAARAANHDLTV